MMKTNSLYVSSPVNALVKGILREEEFMIPKMHPLLRT